MKTYIAFQSVKNFLKKVTTKQNNIGIFNKKTNILKYSRSAVYLIFKVLIVILFLNVKIMSQSVSFCGVLPPNQASSTNPDSIELDRFGNTYDIFSNSNSQQIQLCNSGYYDLRFGLGFSNDMCTLICRVFEEYSSMFPRRTNYNACGEIIPLEDVIIQVGIDNSSNFLGAAGSARYPFPFSKDNCKSITASRVEHKINGGRTKNPGTIDGMLTVNTTLNWNLDFDILPQSNQLDLRTAISHEVLHIMGISSLIEEFGNAQFEYTAYDKYLNVVNFYKPSQTIDPVLAFNCGINCFNLNPAKFINGQAFKDALYDNCELNSGTLDFVFGNSIVPLVGAFTETGKPRNPVNATTISQMMVHFHPICNNFAATYLMDQYLDYGQRRYITADEKKVMCELGYKTIDPGHCDGCYLVNYSELSLEEIPRPFSCCAKFYFTCPSREVTIDFDDLLCNNADNDLAFPGAFISDVFTSNPMDVSIIMDNINRKIKITCLSEGLKKIGYTTTGCDCKMDNGYFFVEVGPCLPCNINKCITLAKSYDFENLPVGNGLYSTVAELCNGVYWEFENTLTNSVDVCEVNGNNFLHMNYVYDPADPNFVNNEEGICFYLCDPIPPLCTLKVELDAASAVAPVRMRLFASNGPPCNASDQTIIRGGQQSTCVNGVYQPWDIEDQNYFPPAGVPLPFGGCPTSISFTHYQFEWINTKLVPMNYIMIYPEKVNGENFNSLFIDNVSFTKSCLPDVDFSYTVNGCSVTFQADPNITGASYSWDFGDNSSGTGLNPNHTYVTSGNYTVVLTVSDDCGNSKIITHLVTVNCNPEPVCKCLSGITIGINSQSVTDITATPIQAISTGRNVPICINGKLRINRFVQIFRDKIIYMGEGASIEITNGNYLYSKESDYLPCNGIMYQGITVNGGRIAAFGNKIYDAHIGIDLKGGATSSGITGNTFERNYIGINVTGPLAGDTRILGNHFFSNGTYLPSYFNEPVKLGTQNKTWAGVNLLSTTLISINDNNEFFGIGAGVRANKSILVMNKNHAKDLLYTAQFENGSALIASDCSSIILNDNSIENCTMAVAVSRSNLTADLNSIDNCDWGFYLDEMDNRNLQISNSKKIYFNTCGIYLTGSSNLANLNIFSNRLRGLFSGANAAISIQGSGGANQGNANIYNHNTEFSIPSECWGIHIYNYRRINVYNNNIAYQSGGKQGIFLQIAPLSFLINNTITGYKSAAPRSIGIAALKSPYTTYCCNNVPGSGIGMNFSGDCDLSHLKHNTMSNNNFGLQCEKSTWIGPQKLGYSNTWPGLAVNYEAFHNGSPPDMSRSKFDVTNGPSDFFPVPAPPAIWFEPRAGSDKSCIDDASCPTPLSPNPYISDLRFRFYNEDSVLVNFTDHYTADPYTNWGSYSEGQSWNSKIQLLEKLELFPELLGQDSLVDAFFNTNLISTLRNYYNKRLAIMNSSNIDQSTLNIIKSIKSGIDSSIMLIEYLDDQLALTGADTATIMNLRNIELDNLTNLRIQNEAEFNSIETNRIGLLSNLLTQVQQLVVNDSIQGEEKEIDLHLIQYLIHGNQYLTSSILNNIFEIANQCFHQNSYSILLARMLYNKVIVAYFDDEVLCNYSLPFSTGLNSLSSENDIRIYPNPTKNLVTIENLNLNSKILNIDLMDIHGRIITLESIKYSGNNLIINTSHLVSGVYFLNIEFNDNKSIIRKLLIE